MKEAEIFFALFLYYCTTSFAEVHQSMGRIYKTPRVKDVIQVMAISQKTIVTKRDDRN